MLFLALGHLVLGFAPENPNFADHIAPILHRHCVTCHRPGEVAPFPLITFEDARKRAKFISQVVQQGSMPPWKAEPGYNRFHDERVLTPGEKATLKAWAETGAPAGDLAKGPKPPSFEQGWRLGKPDLVLEMPAEFLVPASGKDVYRCFVLPTGLKEDRTVAAIEFQPGNPRVVHHALVFLDRSGKARALDQNDPEAGYGTFGGPGFLPSGGLGGWAPGNMPRRLPEGMGRMLSQGSDVVLQLHYHPSGKEEKDKSRVGIYFTPQPARDIVGMVPLLTRDIRIPAGEKRYQRHVEFTTPEALRVVSVTPHMHLLGREMKVRAITPQGKEIPLIWVRDWNFNWQDTYMCQEEVAVPAGSKLVMDAWYDNSGDNPLNPSSPPKVVTWGEQTTNEMCLCFISLASRDPESMRKVRTAALRQMVSPAMLLQILSGR
jgi:hypothetical protein